MGFETQEEAERWYEAAEMRADQARDEKMLASLPRYSDEHLIGTLRGCALIHGSADMKAELMAAADRLEALSREVRSYRRFEADINAALNSTGSYKP